MSDKNFTDFGPKVEQDLSSNSTTSVPSIAAVKSSIPATTDNLAPGNTNKYYSATTAFNDLYNRLGLDLTNPIPVYDVYNANYTPSILQLVEGKYYSFQVDDEGNGQYLNLPNGIAVPAKGNLVAFGVPASFGKSTTLFFPNGRLYDSPNSFIRLNTLVLNPGDFVVIGNNSDNYNQPRPNTYYVAYKTTVLKPVQTTGNSTTDVMSQAAVTLLGGRNKGKFSPNTTYNQYDLITRPDGLALVSAKANFTSGASYNSNDWDFTSSLDYNLLNFTKAITTKEYSSTNGIGYSFGGYTTLNSALYQGNNARVIMSNIYEIFDDNLSIQNQVYYLYGLIVGDGQFIYTPLPTFNIFMNDSSKTFPFKVGMKGVTIGMSSVGSNIQNGQSAGTINIKNTYSTSSINCAIILESVINYLDISVDSTAILKIVRGYHKKIGGTGTVYLYDDCIVDTIDRSNGLMVYDFRPLYSGPTPQAIKSAVSGGSFTNGELQGTQPSGSLKGMRFTDTNYRYEFMNSSADTDGTSLAWTRTVKG